MMQGLSTPSVALVREHTEERLFERPPGRCLRMVLGLVVLGVLGGCASAPTSNNEVTASEVPADVQNELPTAQSADEARERAAHALGRGDLDLALYMLLQAVELDPTDADSMHAVGVIHDRKGNKDLAARAYAHALEIDDAHPLALQDLGIARFEERELDRARQLLEQAVAVDASLWRAHNVLGVIADSRADYQAATRHYTSALQIRPGAPSILNNRGYSHYMAGNLDDAEADLLAATAADPEYGRAWHNLGLVYARQRRYGFALSALSNVMTRYVAANDVGYLAMQDGDYDAAAMLFEEAVRLSPRYYAIAEQNVAELRRRRGGEPVLSVER